MGEWSVDLELIQEWLDELDSGTAACVEWALQVLRREGPNLGRPLVDTVKGSRFVNMKELRPTSPGDSEIRILFAFDPRRKAIMLLAGDKSKGGSRQKWNVWYRKAIPLAEKLFERHLKKLRS